ncbi:MAG: dockerin type I repeat-containing protein [Bacteroidales bacterium]
MKKIILFCLKLTLVGCFILFTLNVKAQEQSSVIIDNAICFTDSTMIIDIHIQSEIQYFSFQFDISIPDGFSYVDNSVSINPPGFKVYAGALPDSISMRVLGLSMGSTVPFLVNISFILNTPSQAGIYQLNLSDAFLSTLDIPLLPLDTSDGVITLLDEPVFLPGDANCDGEVNIQDVVCMLSYILGNIPHPFCFINADINEDGIIDITDGVSTVNIILNRR